MSKTVDNIRARFASIQKRKLNQGCQHTKSKPGLLDLRYVCQGCQIIDRYIRVASIQKVNQSCQQAYQGCHISDRYIRVAKFTT